MTNLEQFRVVQHFETYGGDFIVYRPVIALNFFLSKSTSEIGPAVATSIERFVDFIPKSSLASSKKANGEDGPLTSRTFQRDLKKLRSGDDSLIELRYHSGTPSNVGDYGVVLISDVLEPDLPTFTNILRFTLPHENGVQPDDDGIPALIEILANDLPFQSGFAGYAIAYLDAFANQVYATLPGILMRYVGIDPGYTRTYRFIGGATPDAHWITLLADDLLEPLGGRSALARAVPTAETKELSRGVLVRATAVPPIGDVNRGATDLGALPDLARFMRPSRVDIPHMFTDDFDPARWLSRFDERLSGRWDNRP